MSLYVAKHFTATATGSRVVDVACDRCHLAYHYQLVRQGTGTGSAPYYLFQAAAEARAHRNAAVDLKKRLTRESEPAACPGCGWVNEASVVAYRRRHHRGWFTAAWTLFVACAFVLVLVGVGGRRPLRGEEWLPMAVLALGAGGSIAGGLLFVQARLRRRFDPNRDFPAPRLPVGTPVAWRDGETATGAITPDATATAADDRAVVFRMGTLVLPNVCCECLAPATLRYTSPFPIGGKRAGEIAMPVCDPCYRELRGRWWRVALAASAVVCWLAMVAYFAIPDDPEGSRAGAVALACVGLVFGVPAAVAVVPNWRVRPYAFKLIDAPRSLARVRFRNADYAALSRAATESR